jgi:hypothetical protein
MTTTVESAERMALRGILLLFVEVQNLARQAGPTVAEADPFQTLDAIEDLVESEPARELVQLARAALDAASSRKKFFGIVTQYDCGERYREKHNAHQPERPQGPIIFEQYLNEAAADRKVLEARARTMTGYGWVRVAEISVEIPSPTPVAIPEAIAGVHA